MKMFSLLNLWMLFKLYIDPYSHFENMAFDVFKFLINHSNEQPTLEWWSELTHLVTIFRITIHDKINDMHALKLLMVLVFQFCEKM
jgi:hypothetical protein